MAKQKIEKEQIKGLINEVNKIDESRFHDKDLIGRVYEYFLQVFAMDDLFLVVCKLVVTSVFVSGYVRANLNLDRFGEIQISLPSVDIQKKFVNLYNAISRCDSLKAQIKDICPILIKGSMEGVGL